MLTKELLSKIYPKTKSIVIGKFIEPLNITMDKYSITTKFRIAAFLAQVGEESMNLNVVEENLRYSSKGLLQVFPKYFNVNNVAPYIKNPEKIANRVYANRMGNGDEASGDGYRHRGFGLIQLTGKATHQAFADSMGMTLDEVLIYLKTAEGATISAGWFWDTRKLNQYADKDDIATITKKINGSLIDISDRKKLYEYIKTIV